MKVNWWPYSIIVLLQSQSWSKMRFCPSDVMIEMATWLVDCKGNVYLFLLLANCMIPLALYPGAQPDSQPWVGKKGTFPQFFLILLYSFFIFFINLLRPWQYLSWKMYSASKFKLSISHPPSPSLWTFLCLLFEYTNFKINLLNINQSINTTN